MVDLEEQEDNETLESTEDSASLEAASYQSPVVWKQGDEKGKDTKLEARAR